MDETDTRVAIVGIIIENTVAVTSINTLLHEYGSYIIARMGIPYSKKNINIISVALDAPQVIISALTGKLGHINGVSVKTVYSKI